MEYMRFNRASSGRISVDSVYAPCIYDEYGRDLSSCPFRKEFDVVIACPGWRFSNAIFEPGISPRMHSNGKHPALRPGSFEGEGTPGIFFAGALMHGTDFRVSSGGFIHGFRYLCRALHRELEELEDDDVTARITESVEAVEVFANASAANNLPPPYVSAVPSWPHTDLSACGFRGLVAALLRRINLAAGPFQMFGTLADVVLLHPFSLTEVVGFSGTSVLAPLSEPSSFPPPSPECMKAAVHDPFAPFFGVPSKLGHFNAYNELRRVSDATIERALRGSLYEEVLVKAVSEKTERWASISDAARSSGVSRAHTEWIMLTLEFGRTTSRAKSNQSGASLEDAFTDMGLIRRRDPFSRLRAKVDPQSPEESRFLHPVLRYYSKAPGLEATLLSELHIVEDFDADWSRFRPHVLALARWLQVRFQHVVF